MTTQRRQASRTIAVFLAITLGQVLLLSVAIPSTAQQFVARITTTGNQPVTVNNATAASGASILTGATIETPAGVSATVQITRLGSVALEQNTSLRLDFEQGKVKITLSRGCVVMKKRGANEAEIYTAEGASEKTRADRKELAFCFGSGGTLEPFKKDSTGD